jgi:hypothetical protein
MSELILFPVTCEICDQQTQNFQPILNEISQNSTQEYICSECLDLVDLCRTLSENDEKNNLAQAKRQAFRLIDNS